VALRRVRKDDNDPFIDELEAVGGRFLRAKARGRGMGARHGQWGGGDVRPRLANGGRRCRRLADGEAPRGLSRGPPTSRTGVPGAAHGPPAR
jgi:hypothetical protein